ncbi:elongation factor P maturation arginine rhamnosyltransferase EarP [Shewanella avicenniae]|uniref:Protein-arginine rhamnosyltransferase n=1 Tax=Shewanella avicenniae TaxID=2814294 RepID=A0ABX7QWM5_9GAMM|nr:elongation factor P maturation arginine rhamnosyltransferase EarP [Shewanella avicenniae]QSX35233.1 elongation factor P maturation arginine rhamnosyltransferase EarP [Shewanella avicenniae]
MATRSKHSHWDIFCTVVDNYGDIGVTWRLAKQLANEYQLDVKLWVDDLNSFRFILPALDLNQAVQQHQQVTIIKWDNPLSTPWIPGAVLIEAFACELPSEIIDATATLTPFPHWINLEYLSAESWIDDCHGLQSPVKNGIKKRFFFPGFSAKSGGLICERGLLEERERWQQQIANRADYFNGLGLNGIDTQDCVISLFSYETAAITGLCEQLAKAPRSSHLLVPQGRALTSVASALAIDPTDLATHRQIQHGQLTVHLLPMQNQEQYDRLLWSCDINIVRGEDSFLRAQWAARPFIWHIYPQDEDAHLDKLSAFMARYCDQLAPDLTTQWKALNFAFNQADVSAFNQAWQMLNSDWPRLTQHSKVWPKYAINDADLANRLVQMLKNG